MPEDLQRLYSHYSVVFPVDNVTETIKWYEQNLDCTVFFTYGDPTDYAVLSLNNDLRIHLTRKDDDFSPSDRHAAIYVFVHDIEQVFEHMKQKGLTSGVLATADYGMRDFSITDLNGYRITFGQSTP